MIKTIEGNTSGGKGLVANGGCVAEKQYANNYNRIAVIIRPKYVNGDQARAVVAEAKKWIGYPEKKSNKNLESFTANVGYNNYNIFAKHAKEQTGSSVYVNGAYWCDMFVDDIFIRALGVIEARNILGGWSAYTPDSANMLKRAGGTNVLPDQVKFGDIIFFKNSTRICHIGIVTNGYTEKPAQNNKFEYTQEEFEREVMQLTGTSTKEKALTKVLTLSEKKNSKDILVLPVQKMLKSLGFYEGTPDRDFGKLTTAAVNKYQKDILKYKKCDGEITKGGKMWRSLMGMKV